MIEARTIHNPINPDPPPKQFRCVLNSVTWLGEHAGEYVSGIEKIYFYFCGKTAEIGN